MSHSPDQQTRSLYLPVDQYVAHQNSSYVHQSVSPGSQCDAASLGGGTPVPQNTPDPEHENGNEQDDSPSAHGGALSNITSAITTGFHTLTDAVGITHHDPQEQAGTQGHAENEDSSSDNAEEAERERARAAQYRTGSGTTEKSRTYQAAVDYEGADYASSSGDHASEQTAPGSGVRDQLHHHPTRLSDVLEEDERSRTTRRSSGSGVY